MKPSQDLTFELQNVLSQLRRTKILKNDHSKLKGAEKHILFLVYELRNSSGITISQIAKKMGVTLAAVTHQVNALEEQKLIKRVTNKSDRRANRIDLTSKGKGQITKLKKEFAKKTKILAKFLGESDTRHLIRLVRKMSEFPEFIK